MAKDPFEILKQDEIKDLQELWWSDIGNYWKAIQQIAEASGVETRHVTEEVWRGTPEHTAFWRGHRA